MDDVRITQGNKQVHHRCGAPYEQIGKTKLSLNASSRLHGYFLVLLKMALNQGYPYFSYHPIMIMLNLYKIVRSTRLLFPHILKFSQVPMLLSNSRRYLSLRQYVLAQLELRRAETLPIQPQQQQQLLMIRGQMELQKPQPDLNRAIELFDSVLQGHKYIIKASLYKIECLKEANRLQEYIDKIDKSDPKHLVQLAYAMFLTERYSQAIEWYSKCIINGLTTYPEIYQHAAISHFHLGQYVEAQKHFQKQLQLQPRNNQTATYLLSIYWLHKKYDEIIRLCDKVLKNDPGEIFAKRYKGICLYLVGNYQQAVTWLTQAIDLQEDVEARIYRAKSNIKLNNQQQALTDYEEIIRQNPPATAQTIQAAIKYYEIKKISQKVKQQAYEAAMKAQTPQQKHLHGQKLLNLLSKQYIEEQRSKKILQC